MSDVSVSIVRTKNRHSRAVLTNDGIEIRLAHRLPAWLEQKHIDSLVQRMQQAVLRERQKQPIDPFCEVLKQDGQHAIRLGNGRTFSIYRQQGKRTSLRKKEDTWLLTVSPQTTKNSLHRLLWRRVCETETERIAALVLAVNNRTFRLPVKNVQVRYTRTQWGSCGHDGRICLSGALLFVEERLLTYVIVHELAHLRYRSHGPRFWGLVAEALPDFRHSIKALREHRIVRI